MFVKDDPLNRLETLYRKLFAKRVAALAAGDVPRALRYDARATTINNAADVVAFRRASTFR